MTRLILLIILLFSASGKANGGEQSKSESLEEYLKKLAYEPIVFTYYRNHPIVEGQIGDKKCSLAVDTGCTITRLDPPAATGLKTLAELGATSNDPFARLITNYDSVLVIEKLKLGRAEFINQPAEREKVNPAFVKSRYRGILGFDFMVRNFCLIDCLGHRLYVRGQKPSDDISKALAGSLRRSGYTNISLRGFTYFTVPSMINGQPAELLVDTGSWMSVMDQSEEQRLSLYRERQEVTGTHIPQEVGKLQNAFVMRMAGEMDTHRLRFATVKTLQIGGVEWHNRVLALTDLKAWGMLDSKGKKRFSGTIGADTLALQGALIDFSTRTLWFQIKPREK